MVIASYISASCPAFFAACSTAAHPAITIISTSDTSVVQVKLTNKGRELLTKGFNDVDTFDIVKFAFGDSEIDYTRSDAEILVGRITYPDNSQADFKSKLYESGSIPTGTPAISLSVTSLNLTNYTESSVNAYTTWSPVQNIYIEDYKWINLGPLNDWDFEILPANNTRSAKIKSYDITGSTVIKVVGQTSGKYNTIIVNIT